MSYRTLIAALAIACAAGTARADYTFEDAFPLLPTFTEPIDLQDPLDGTDRLFVIEKEGRIRVFNNDPSANTAGVFLDISAAVNNVWESGLIGLAFHPDYESNGYFYVVYITEDPVTWRLSRFTVSGNPDVANPASELIILEVPQTNLYHKGGCLVFDADGYLYVSTGEDGWHTDAIDLTKFKGKLLHLDVDNPSGGNNYGIPPNNPYAGNTQGYLEEIWAYGFRNPWRFAIDEWTGRLWLADVGNDVWEEINLVKKARNYGWSRMEGPDCLYPPECDTTGLNIVLPFHAYAHTSEYGGAVIGGNVYRGTRLPSLNGHYLYTDHAAGEVWGLVWDGVNPPDNYLLFAPGPQDYRIADICTDKDQEMFWASYINGRIWQLTMIPSDVDDRTPAAAATLLVHPNPFAGQARIQYSSPGGTASLEVYDVRGRLVRRVAEEVRGTGEVTWDGRDLTNVESASGVYFVRLTRNGKAIATRRVVLLK